MRSLIMKLRCPECKLELDANYLCENGHKYFIEDNVLLLMNQDFKSQLQDWLESFDDYRSEKRIKLDFSNLPLAGVAHNKNIWEARIEDLSIIEQLMPENCKTVLDVGSWNGWLANQLSKSGKNVTAIDYFIHELDGLKAKKHYGNPVWNSIQMDLENIDIFQEKFDLIILNRCFAYFTNKEKTLSSLYKLLAPKGKLIITGINILNERTQGKNELSIAQEYFVNKYGKNILFKPSKGFMDSKDLSQLKSKGVGTFLYPNWKNRIKKFINYKKGIVYYGVFSSQEDSKKTEI